jgi:hypothetical protein
MRLGSLLTLALCFGVGCNGEAQCLLECIDRVEVTTTATLPEHYIAEVHFGDTLLIADCSRNEEGLYFDLNMSGVECEADRVSFESSAASITIRVSAADGSVLADGTVLPAYESQETCGDECLLGKAEIEVAPTS